MTVLILDDAFTQLFTGELISMNNEGSATITDYPVEQGAAATDHAQPNPEELRITVGVTDTPLTGAAQPGASAQAYDTLDQLRRRPQLVRVITSRRSLSNLVLSQVSAPYNDRSGRAILIDLSFKRVIVTQTTTAAIPVAILAQVRKSSAKGKDKTQDAARDETAKEAKARRKTIGKGIADLVRPSF